MSDIDKYEEKEYDVVVDVLQKHIDTLWNLSKNKDQWDIMDDIRFEQIEELKRAINIWKKYK